MRCKNNNYQLREYIREEEKIKKSFDSKKDIVVYPGSHSDPIKITNLSSSDIKAFESVILEANKYSKNITLRYLNNFFNNPNIRKV